MAARARLEDLLGRFPQDVPTLSKLAEIELASGDPARARDLYAELVAKNPEFPELSNLGLANLLLGDLGPAERDLRRAAELEPKNPGALLNLADVVELQGRREEASALYRKTLELAEKDPAAAHWQIQTIRAQALAHLGRAEQAVAAIQSVLAQEDSQASFEAAVVFALVGDLALRPLSHPVVADSFAKTGGDHRGVTKGEALMQLQAAVAIVGPASSSPYQVAVTFPQAFNTVPVVVASTLQDPNYPPGSIGDTFAFAVTSTSTTGFTAQILRSDIPGGGWDQNLSLGYFASTP